MNKTHPFNPQQILYIGIFIIIQAVFAGCGGEPGPVTEKGQSFNQERAYDDMVQQLEFGPRIPGSDGHQKTVEYIIRELHAAGWSTKLQSGTKMGHEVKNVIAYRKSEQPHVLLGAHYDTRLYADRDPDPDRRKEPVPGANDGASGVAVLLELARVLPPTQDVPVRLVFFDAEDNGSIQGWDWILGSRLYAEKMKSLPKAVVIVDMVGDRDLNLYQEKNSTPGMQDQIWRVAHELGYESAFINDEKHSILDDHTPFLELGIPAVDIIDFDYPSWHTTQDTLDKVSPRSLDIVGETLLVWLQRLEAANIE